MEEALEPLTVIDIFCGAGGFSEGFRQQGFEIRYGIDRWQPAVETFNHNFGLKCVVRDVVEFLDSVEAIEELPDTDVILGSPPCVSFSSSNISGKADKSQGVKLTQIFLRIVAVKKWKKKSQLKAWYMENVPQSAKHLAKEYSFRDLGLEDWAEANRIGPSKIALTLEPNRQVVNSADYGCPQTRLRVISGEIISKRGTSIVPEPTHSAQPEFTTKPWLTIQETIKKLPSPSVAFTEVPQIVVDPNYSNLSILGSDLTDHFYDTGLYESEWRLSKYLKTNHPYMGRMSFPEDESRPSRTVTATKIGSSREALIYKSPFDRVGDGEFRTPTIREAACLMGFPITYQFKGSEGTKWRLVGNAVCPSVSRALASLVRKELGLEEVGEPQLVREAVVKNISNLNTFVEKDFDNPPKKRRNSRFRRHPFKDGNMTVTLSNYDIENKEAADASRWLVSVQYGSGEGFPTFIVNAETHLQLREKILGLDRGEECLEAIEKDVIAKTATGLRLQEMYEQQCSENGYLEPTRLVERLAEIIEQERLAPEFFVQNDEDVFRHKKKVPTKQVVALYGLCRIAHLANSHSTSLEISEKG